MTNGNDKFPALESFGMILNGTSLVSYTAVKDKKKYEDFKASKQQILEEGDSRTFAILSILEGLGYPMNELGTYLYKEVIVSVCQLLENMSEEDRNMNNFKSLLSDLNNDFSNFYHLIARDYFEMGVKSFHLCIKEAIDKIDHDLVNLKLAKAVFKHNPEKLTYGSQAFLIAAYVSGLFTKENQHEIKTEVVKKIVKTSNNVPMK